MNFKMNSLALAVTVAISSTPVLAEDISKEKIEEIEVIQVTGIRGSLVKSLFNKRSANTVVDGISAEDLGKFPDQNVAESLQRITGVTIEREGGEGSKISIRGFGPEFNVVLLNQRTVPTEGATRAFSFDMLASELISGADVHKTTTASMTEGSIGGLVNITTAKPLEYEGFKAVASAKAVYDGLADSTNPYISGLISQNFDGEFGVLASFAYQERESRKDEAFIGGYTESSVGTTNDPTNLDRDNVWRPQTAGQKLTAQNRKRTGATITAQWIPSDSLSLTADVIYSRLVVDDEQHELSRWFSNPVFGATINEETNTVTAFSRTPKPYVSTGVFQLWEDGTRLGTGQWNSATRRGNNRDVTTTMVGLNAEWNVSDELAFEFDIQTSSAESDSGVNPYTVLANPTQNITKFSMSGNSFSWIGQPSDFIGTSKDLYHAHNVSFSQFQRDDDITELHTNIEWTPEDMGFISSVQTGAYYSYREKVKNNAATNYSNVFRPIQGFHFSPSASILTDFSPTGGFLSDEGGFLDSWYTYNPTDLVDFLLSPEALAQTSGFGDQIMNNFANGDPTYGTQAEAQVAADNASDAGYARIEALQSYVPVGNSGHRLGAFAPEHNASSSWRVTEETTSFFVQANLEGEYWSGNIGLRYITTDTESFGTGTVLTGYKLDSGAGAAGLDKESGQAVSDKGSYNKALPSMNLKFDLSDDLVARISYSETLTRPNLSKLTPTENYSGEGQMSNGELVFDGGTITSQNVNLKPYTSDNFDLALEWYYAESSYVGVTYFNKQIHDWITTLTEDVIVEVPYFVDDIASGTKMLPFSKSSPYNAEDSDASGIEFALLHNFDNGFGVQFNYTYIDSDAAFTPGQEDMSFTLDGLSKDSFNLITYYESGPFQARVAYNWRSEYVNCATCSGGSKPIQTEAYGQFDASASYDINETINVFIEGVNILDEDTRKFSVYKSRLLSFSDTGSRFSLGVRAKF
ncbi:MAG: TonB-dependent receptor [Colwellia sp.]